MLRTSARGNRIVSSVWRWRCINNEVRTPPACGLRCCMIVSVTEGARQSLICLGHAVDWSAAETGSTTLEVLGVPYCFAFGLALAAILAGD